MIRLQRSLIAALEVPNPTVQAVCTALQQAVELEHATLPLYLYALYSLDTAKNPDIANIIESVTIEEMLHMTLSANVLNALGGSPQIDKPGFIPTYPGQLPGGVESSLTAHIAPFSMAQLETFLIIEEPENQNNYGAPSTPSDGITIGEFYDAIIAAIEILGDSVFTGPASNQVGPDLMPESVVVTDVASAKQAIQTIIEQGEGASTSPSEVVGDDVAHYYRFMQIKEGAYLVLDPHTKTYSYTGKEIKFDAGGVYPVASDPKAANYPVGSISRNACDIFNYTYTGLLTALHSLFNGQANQTQLNVAIGLMMSMKGQAKAMMSGIPDPSVMTGPSFEYQPVNPRVSA